IGVPRGGGDGGSESGYCTHKSRPRRGFGTAAAEALTSVALGLPGVRRVEIHCDEPNPDGAAIPRKLGSGLDGVIAHEPEAPGESGRRMIWVWDASGAGAG